MIQFPDTRLDERHSLNPYEQSLLLHFLAASSPKLILELGVYKGNTTKLIANWLNSYNVEAKIVGFDIEPVLKDLLKEDPDIQALIDSGTLQFEAGYLPQTLDHFLSKNNQSIDFALIDAKHDYESVYGELNRIWPFLSEKGFIVCHDYHKPRIQYAIERFSRLTGAQHLPILSSPEESVVYSSLSVITKPKIEFKTLRWLVYHSGIKKKRGYYFLKKIFPDFFNSID